MHNTNSLTVSNLDGFYAIPISEFKYNRKLLRGIWPSGDYARRYRLKGESPFLSVDEIDCVPIVEANEWLLGKDEESKKEIRKRDLERLRVKLTNDVEKMMMMAEESEGWFGDLFHAIDRPLTTLPHGR